MPGAFIVLTPGQPAAGNPLVNRLGIWAKDLDPIRARLTAAGIPTAPKAQFIDLPNALRLEFIDDPARPDPAAHHIHYFVANQQDGLDARAWYMKTFGATENARRNGGVPSALLTAPDKWISVDFMIRVERFRCGNRGHRLPGSGPPTSSSSARSPASGRPAPP